MDAHDTSTAGLAVAWSRRYPRWLGWVVAAAGVGSVAAGLVQAGV